MIMVVGGAGYIGSHVNKLLSQRGYPSLVVDNLSTGHRDFVKWGEFFSADLGDKQQLRECFKRYSVEAVMHFSAFAYVGESVIQPAKYYRNNVSGTLNLLEVMTEFKVRQLVFSSSCTVYGHPATLPIAEGHPRVPISPYGRTKFMVEEILKDFENAYGLKYLSLRYFNAAGADLAGEIGEEHEPETHLIPLALLAALGVFKEFHLYGTDYPTPDGTCIRDYVHVNDIADAHIRGLEHLMSNGESDFFNLGNGEGYSVREVLKTAQEISGRDIRIIEDTRRPGDPDRLVSDSRKAQKVLGWTPRYPDLKTIIGTAWSWHSKRDIRRS